MNNIRDKNYQEHSPPPIDPAGRSPGFLSLRTKFSLFVSIVIILVCTGLSGFLIQQEAQIMKGSLLNTGKILVKTLSKVSTNRLIIQDIDYLETMLEGALSAKEVVYAMVKDQNGKVLVAKSEGTLTDITHLTRDKEQPFFPDNTITIDFINEHPQHPKTEPFITVLQTSTSKNGTLSPAPNEERMANGKKTQLETMYDFALPVYRQKSPSTTLDLLFSEILSEIPESKKTRSPIIGIIQIGITTAYMQQSLNQTVRAHEQRTLRLTDGFGGEIALHLALVGPEVRQHQERPADHARPERVPLAHVEREVEDSQPAGRPGDPERFVGIHGHLDDEHDHDRDERDDDQDHLLHVGPRDGLNPADHRVDHRGDADEGHRPNEGDAEDRAEDHPRSRHDGAGRESPRDQEEKRGQRARPRVEAALQILVRSIDARPVQQRDDRHAEDHHREREPQVQLDEAHAVRGALTRRADHRDRRELCRHHREAHDPPRQALVGEEVARDRVGVLRLPDAVHDYPDHVDHDDQPVDPVH